MSAAYDWWASERTVAPPEVKLISTENRKVSVALSNAVVAGEAIQGGTLVAEVRRYRDDLVVSPSPIILPLSYDSGTKVAAVKIDADNLPKEPCILIFTFDVTFGAATEQRSVWAVLKRDV